MSLLETFLDLKVYFEDFLFSALFFFQFWGLSLESHILKSTALPLSYFVALKKNYFKREIKKK